MLSHSLHIITTGRQELSCLKSIVSNWEPGQVDALHIREKSLGAREIARWYSELAEAIPHTPVYINDRLDAALAAGAPGVQLGFASLPPETARRILPATTRIGLSVHSREEAADAHLRGADFVLFGHIFETASKPGLPPRGTEALRQVVDACSLPVIAIGGIEPVNTPEVLATGCAGIAVLSSVLLHPDPEGQIRRFREAMAASAAEPRRSF